MGISSPTKLQLKHIPDRVVLETVYCIQNQWALWFSASGEMADMNGEILTVPGLHYRGIHYRRKRMASIYEICAALQPLPEKLVWRKLQKLEDQRKIESYGPAGIRYRVLD